jgi:hypothetical protein
VVLRSILIWLAVTVSACAAMIFIPPGLDLGHIRDDYMGYWDFRLAFFLVPWIGISLPPWALGTWLVARRISRRSSNITR